MRTLVKTLIAACAVAAGAALAPAARATDVGISISVAQPGVYGRIDIGRFPQPAVIVPRPVVIAPPPVVVAQPVQPVYMWVPYGHRKNWSKHCHKYHACGVPVYFVRHDWYRQHVMADHRHQDRRHDHRHDDRRGRDRRHDDHPGKGHGHGKGR